MNYVIKSNNELLDDKELLFKVYEVYKYISRCNMTKEEFWTIEEGESLEDIKKIFDEGYNSFINNLKDKGSYYVIAEENNQIIGELYLVEEDDKCFTISDLAVDFNNRRLGIASRLIEEAISFVNNNYNGYSLISYIDYDNTPSINLHKKLGFELTSEEKDMGKNGCFVYRYKKRKC